MNELIELTASKLKLERERVIYLAYEYAEQMPHSPKKKKRIVQTILADKCPPEVEDYCLAILSGRTQ